MLDYLMQFEPHAHMLAFALGSTRLMVFAMVAPFMGSAVVTGTAKSALVLSLYLVIHPAVLEALPVHGELTGAVYLTILFLALKEAFIGFILGWLAGLVFWAVEAAGMFIDNQRGAASANEMNMMTAEQSTPHGRLPLPELHLRLLRLGHLHRVPCARLRHL